jgi:hypothetical protein
MAAKDVDLATDYIGGGIFLVEENEATFELINIPPYHVLLPADDLFLVDLGVGGGGVTYRMRGYETVLEKHVFWNSSTVDSVGADYSGNSGNLTDVGVQRVVGQP